MSRFHSICRFLVLALLSVPTALAAQESGRIVGRVVEAEQGAPLAGAQVELVGTGIRTVSALDGRYTILNVPAGTASISVRLIGFQPKTVTGLLVSTGKVTEQNVSLSNSVVQIEELAVTAQAEKGSVNQALDEQRNAVNLVNAISAEQMEKSPDREAAQAIKRVSGVTVQDDKYVIVRGLGERYTQTSLNGARIPSPEQERKVVPLDLFPSSMLDAITTSKTFTPEQPGDFAGASVDLRTKEFPAGRKLSFGVGMGFNGAATGKDIVKAPTTGTEWLGYGGSERDIPVDLKNAGNLNGLSQGEVNSLIGQMRNVWSPNSGGGAPNGGFNAAVGGEDPVFGHLLGYMGSFTYGFAQEVHKDETRGLARNGDTPGTAEPLNTYTGSSAKNSVLWGGMANLSTRLGAGTRLNFNNSYNRTADNEASLLGGPNEEFGQDFSFSRLTFTERSVRSNQLTGEHLIGQRNTINWSVTSSGVTREEPDRSDVGYTAVPNGSGGLKPQAWFGQPRFATRTYSDLSENAWDLGAGYRYALGSVSDPVMLKFGGAARFVNRTSESRPYDIINQALPDADLTKKPEEVFSTANIDASSFLLRANAFGGNYTADDQVLAGYVQAEVPVSQRLQLVGGARVENWQLDVTSLTTDGTPAVASPRNTDVLPSIAATYRLTSDQNIRASATQTLSRPEYRELSPVPYFEQVGFFVTIGNPDLKRALIQNFDLRWEWFPRAGEVLSIGVFGKHFDAPIEKVIIQAAGTNTLSFVNANSATNLGVELEARKSLDFLGDAFRTVSLFTNATLISSKISIGNEGISAATNPDRAMVGQSPYVVNAGLNWSSPKDGWNASLLYNVAGKRIVEAGSGGLPDAYEQPRSLLDFAIQVPVTPQLRFRADAKNLLDAPYRLTQGDVVRQRYLTGRVFAFGFTWEP